MVRAHMKQPPSSEEKSEGKKRSSNSNKKKHGDGQWPCKINGCNKVFAREADLKRHQRTTKSHAQPGFFNACPQCDAKFTRTDALRRHQKSRHNGVVIEPTEANHEEEDEEAEGSEHETSSRSATPAKSQAGSSKSASTTSTAALVSAGLSPYYRPQTVYPTWPLTRPPSGMIVDPHYAPAIAIPTSAARFNQPAAWSHPPPPPPWVGADGQPTPVYSIPQPIPQPYLQYYRPGAPMMHPMPHPAYQQYPHVHPEYLHPSMIHGGIPPPIPTSASGSRQPPQSSSRSRTPATNSDDSEEEKEDGKQSSERSTLREDHTNATATETQSVSMEESAEHDGSDNEGITSPVDAISTQGDPSTRQSWSPIDTSMERGDSQKAETQKVTETLVASPIKVDGATAQSAAISQSSERVDTTPSEDMVKPEEILTQESLASPSTS